MDLLLFGIPTDSRSSVAKLIVDQRLGPNKMADNNTLGSFIKHGLDHEQYEQEAVLQVYGISHPLIPHADRKHNRRNSHECHNSSHYRHAYHNPPIGIPKTAGQIINYRPSRWDSIVIFSCRMGLLQRSAIFGEDLDTSDLNVGSMHSKSES
jgi:hypothetical protein